MQMIPITNPRGSDTQYQYNKAGVFAGSACLVSWKNSGAKVKALCILLFTEGCRLAYLGVPITPFILFTKSGLFLSIIKTMNS